jgi:hypothetical protein
MKNYSPVNLDKLKKELQNLENEAKKMGLPLARIADITNVNKAIMAVEKHREK